jgi:hypothetical protein
MKYLLASASGLYLETLTASPHNANHSGEKQCSGLQLSPEMPRLPVYHIRHHRDLCYSDFRVSV